MTEEESLRLECLRIAVENGTVADISNPVELADKYYEWVKKKPTNPLMQKERKRTTRS